MADGVKTKYFPWGECLILSNGLVDIVVSLEFGPRILRYGFTGGANELFEDTACAVMATCAAPEMEAYYHKGAYFRMYGGHRVWASPQKMPQTFYPDNDPVEYQLIPNGVVLTAPVQKNNEIQIQLEIELSSGSSRAVIKNRIRNCAGKEKRLCVWGITAMAPSGTEVIPQPCRDNGFWENRNISLWKYSDMADHRVYWGRRYITLSQDPGAADYDEFKLGINNEAGIAFYFNHGNLFVKTYSHLGHVYPNGNISYETYTSNCALEMESLGEFKTLLPGETAEHVEMWELIGKVADPKNDEDQIHATIKEYLRRNSQ